MWNKEYIAVIMHIYTWDMCNLNSNKRRALNILNTTPINCSGGFSSANITQPRETTKGFNPNINASFTPLGGGRTLYWCAFCGGVPCLV